MARMDAMGITVQGIETVSKLFGVKDTIECLMKIRELISHISRLEQERNKDKK